MGEGLIFILKIIFTVLFAPVVYVCAVNFYGHLNAYPPEQGEFFQWGTYAFLLVFLFLHQFQKMYQAGQTAMTEVFKFVSPLDRAIARIVPVYTTAILVALYVWKKFRDVSAYAHYFLFFAGFFFAMHVLLLAREMQDEETSFIKPSYLFQMGLYLVLSAGIVILLLDLVAWQFTFFQFCFEVFAQARNIYADAIDKIF